MAIALSLVFHGALALFAAMLLGSESAPVVAARLEVASVELSIVETAPKSDASAPVVPPPSPSAPPASTHSPPPPLSAPPPTVAETGLITPPAVATDFSPPAPERPRPQFEPPPAAPPPAPAPAQARIDAPPQPRRTIRPDYPRGARQRGEEGDVVVELLVGVDGLVERSSVVVASGFAELDEAALKAVRAAKFIPAKSGGEAVGSTARITLTFRLK